MAESWPLSSMDGDGERPGCPFCHFSVMSRSEKDMYSLLEHLELTHPENGQSPFIANDARSRSRSRSVSRGEHPREREETGQSHSRNRSITPSLNIPGDEKTDDQTFYVECPAKCGEAVQLSELADHMDLHDIEGLAFDDSSRPVSRDTSRHVSPHRPATSVSIATTTHLKVPGGSPAVSPAQKQQINGAPRRQNDYFGFKDLKSLLLGPASKKTRTTSTKARPTTAKRLGKAELGPHAYEDKMPDWLYKQLERGARVTTANRISPTGQLIVVETVANETAEIIPVLAQLCEQDPALSKVFLCHSGVKHVFKQAREGGFCGYRNIQMMVSFIQATKFPGYEHFPGRIPSILHLQDLIELAWDQEFSPSGRVETGGIIGTRKYIGTPEAQALFNSLEIGCDASAFSKKAEKSIVHDAVIESVLHYFSQGVTDPSLKVYETMLPPIYFQHPGHSLTIAGLEIRKSGAMNLLVLDPMFKTSPGIARLLGSRFRAAAPDKLLKAYRRGDSYLGKYNSFEILKLAPSRIHVPSLSGVL